MGQPAPLAKFIDKVEYNRSALIHQHHMQQDVGCCTIAWGKARFCLLSCSRSGVQDLVLRLSGWIP